MMRTMVRWTMLGVVCAVSAWLASATSVAAQERHVVSQAALAAAVAERSDSVEDRRAAVQATLARDEVRAAARKVGLDLERLAPSIDALSEAELAPVAPVARDVDRALAGGASSVTLSTTTIIIGLLVLILIIVAVK